MYQVDQQLLLITAAPAFYRLKRPRCFLKQNVYAHSRITPCNQIVRASAEPTVGKLVTRQNKSVILLSYKVSFILKQQHHHHCPKV